MTAPSWLEVWWVHTVQAEAYLGESGYGPVYGEPMAVVCFLDETRRLVRNASGDQVVSEATVYAPIGTAALFAPESRVTTSSGVRTVITCNARTAPGLGLPEHVEVTLT